MGWTRLSTPTICTPIRGATAPATERRRSTVSAVFEGLVDPICSPSGKPCWITEWGFSYAGKSCSGPEETAHTQLVQEMMGDFRRLAQDGRTRRIDLLFLDR